jgi:hypothetical protein
VGTNVPAPRREGRADQAATLKIDSDGFNSHSLHMITTRHIRHDWQKWIDDHDQKGVRVLCGARAKVGMAGIPGITEQDEIVQVGENGTRYFGWCIRCVYIARLKFPKDYLSLDKRLYSLYEAFDKVVNHPDYVKYLQKHRI